MFCPARVHFHRVWVYAVYGDLVYRVSGRAAVTP
jgi:hypothetical protein